MDSYKIVLTADRTMMGFYTTVLEGAFTAVFTNKVPEYIYYPLLSPPIKTENKSVVYAPAGLRMLEAALLKSGFDENDIVITNPQDLDKVIGDSTKILAVSSGDPLGKAANTSAMREIFGGIPYTELSFNKIFLNKSLRSFKPSICVGGPGAWQIEQFPEYLDKYNIRNLVIGPGEKVVPEIFNCILGGKPVSRIVHGEISEDVPSFVNPTLMGIVEISRGCGRGCSFCTLRSVPLIHFPKDKILKEIKINAENGQSSISLAAEDFLRYGVKGLNINAEKVLDLFESISKLDINRFEVNHTTATFLSQVSTDYLETLHNLMMVNKKSEWTWVNVGIETLSPHLVEAHIKGKIKPFTPNEWAASLIESLGKMNDANWFPIGSILIGLPGESEKDVSHNLEFIENIKDIEGLIMPVFFVSTSPDETSYTLDSMSPSQIELFKACWDYNFKYLESFFFSYYKSAGVDAMRIMRNMIGLKGFKLYLKYVMKTLKAKSEIKSNGFMQRNPKETSRSEIPHV